MDCPLGKSAVPQICSYCNFGNTDFYTNTNPDEICKCPPEMTPERYHNLVEEYKEYKETKKGSKLSREEFWEFVKNHI